MLGSLLGIGGGLIGGLFGDKGERKGRAAMEQGYRQGMDAMRGYYDQSRQDFQPYMGLGTSSVNRLQQLMGGDYSGFEDAPDYQAALRGGTRALDRSAARGGNLFSGGHSADLMEYGGDLASQYLGNYRNSLMQQAGMGQNAVGAMADYGSNLGGNLARMYTGQGQDRASSYANQYGNYGDMGGVLGGGLGKIFGSLGMGGKLNKKGFG